MLYEVVGNVHSHTHHSDGSGTFEDIARAASQAGLDFVIPTDHNVLLRENEGYYDGVLLLVGEETNDPNPRGASHYLSFGILHDVSSLAADPQALIDEVDRQGGFGFIAHPCERPGRYAGEGTFDWLHWDVGGYAGISIWNYMSEFKSYLSNLPATLWAIYFPQGVIRGPFPETLRLYDRLLRERPPVALIGTSDAHANRYSAGPLTKVIFPYDMLFGTVNLHLLLDEPLTHELGRDRALIYEAMRSGRGYIGYGVAGDPRGFRFTARAGNACDRRVPDRPPQDELTTFGQAITVHGEVILEVDSPLRARLRLLHDGVVVAETHGTHLSYHAVRPGAYRVEAYRRLWLRYRGWVFTNPIYVRQA